MINSNSIFSVLIFLSALLLFQGCTLHRFRVSKDITYTTAHNLALDVYAPRKIKELKPVNVFIYGGNWNSGKKEKYKFFGKGMARHGVVTVIVDYRLSQVTTYNGMATDISEAIKWVNQNITLYGGDSNKIFVSGHSAGGHLAALLAADGSYFDALKIKNPLKGTILIDAFGLDIYSYLTESRSPEDSVFLPAFTTNPEVWKKASPVYYLSKETAPFLIFVGGSTYPLIKTDNNRFLNSLIKFQPDTKIIKVKRRTHVGMIAHYINPVNKGYKQIINFMEKN